LEPVKLFVSREHKSESGSHDVIGGGVDEPGIAVELQSKRLFELEFTGNRLGWFLDEGHGAAPFGSSWV
jgi:hypothetical protein